MNIEIILTIVSIALGLGATLFGGKWLLAKGKLNQFKNLAKESYDVVKAVVDALEDDNISKSEIDKIKQEGAEVKAALKILLNK